MHSDVYGSGPPVQRKAPRASARRDSEPVDFDQAFDAFDSSLDAEVHEDTERRFGHHFSQMRVGPAEVVGESLGQVNLPVQRQSALPSHDDPLEKDADRAAAAALQRLPSRETAPVPPIAAPKGGLLQRTCDACGPGNLEEEPVAVAERGAVERAIDPDESEADAAAASAMAELAVEGGNGDEDEEDESPLPARLADSSIGSGNTLEDVACASIRSAAVGGRWRHLCARAWSQRSVPTSAAYVCM